MSTYARLPPTCEATACERPANLYRGVRPKHIEGKPDVTRLVRYCAYHLRLAREGGSEIASVGSVQGSEDPK